MRIIREALLDLMASAVVGLLLYIALRELTRQPGVDTAVFGMVPVTERKLPWLLLLAALLLVLWLGARVIGGTRGTLWGAWHWLVRIGLWWSMAALLLFAGVAAYGGWTRGVADVNWPFAFGYLAVVVPVLLVCGIARYRSGSVRRASV